MAYSTSNPPTLVTQGGIDGSQQRRWAYGSTVDVSTVIADTTGYFTDGYARGMRLNDLVDVTLTGGTVTVVTHRVKVATTTGITLGAGTTIGAA